MTPSSSTNRVDNTIAAMAAAFHTTPEELQEFLFSPDRKKSIDLTKLQDHGPLSNDANQSLRPVLSAPNYPGLFDTDSLDSSVSSGIPQSRFANDSSSGDSVEPGSSDRVELRMPPTPKVIRYTQKTKSAEINGFPCYPGTEENWTEEERKHMYRAKFSLVNICSRLSATVHWFPFFHHPTAQCERRKADWRIYLNEFARDLDMIATYFFANHDYKHKYPEYVEFDDKIRRRDSIWSLRREHTVKNARERNYQNVKESLDKFSKDTFAFTRVDLFNDLEELNTAKMSMLEVKQIDMVSELSKGEVRRALVSLYKYLQYLRNFLLYPEEIEANRQDYSSAKQMRFSSYNEIIENYKTQLSESWVDCPMIVETKYNAEGVHLNCKEIDPNNLPRGFIPCGGGFYEYEYIDPVNKKLYRIPAHCVPFIDSGKAFNNYSTIATCHNESCYNVEHHAQVKMDVLSQHEYMECSGPGSCGHSEPCVLPGRLVSM